MCACDRHSDRRATCTCSCFHIGAVLRAYEPRQPEPRVFVASHTDGSQTLVTFYDDTTGEVARRRRPTDTWGVPTSLRAEVAR